MTDAFLTCSRSRRSVLRLSSQQNRNSTFLPISSSSFAALDQQSYSPQSVSSHTIRYFASALSSATSFHPAAITVGDSCTLTDSNTLPRAGTGNLSARASGIMDRTLFCSISKITRSMLASSVYVPRKIVNRVCTHCSSCTAFANGTQQEKYLDSCVLQMHRESPLAPAPPSHFPLARRHCALAPMCWILGAGGSIQQGVLLLPMGMLR